MDNCVHPEPNLIAQIQIKVCNPLDLIGAKLEKNLIYITKIQWYRTFLIALVEFKWKVIKYHHVF